MGNLELLNLNSKTWESPNSVGWFFDFVATSSGSSFPKISTQKKKLGTIDKTLGFCGFFFKELEKDNLLQSRVFEKSQRTSGFPAIRGKEMTVQGRFLYGFFQFLQHVQDCIKTGSLVFWNNWSRVPMPYPDLSILFFLVNKREPNHTGHPLEKVL